MNSLASMRHIDESVGLATSQASRRTRAKPASNLGGRAILAKRQPVADLLQQFDGIDRALQHFVQFIGTGELLDLKGHRVKKLGLSLGFL